MQQSFGDARQLYFKYGCSKFFMEREGVLRLYRSYNVPTALEHQWTMEYFEQKLKELTVKTGESFSSTTYELSNLAIQANNEIWVEKILLSLYAETYRLDSLSKLLVCECGVRLMSKVRLSNTQEQQTAENFFRTTLIKLRDTLAEGSFTIDTFYKNDKVLSEICLGSESLLARIRECLRLLPRSK